MQRKSRSSSRSQANPTLHSRRKVVRRDGYNSKSFVEIVIVAFLGSLVVMMCGISFYHFTSVTTHEKIRNIPAKLRLKPKAKQHSVKKPKVVASIERNEEDHQRDKVVDPLSHLVKKAKVVASIERNEEGHQRDKVVDSLSHLSPLLPILPVFPPISDSDELIKDTLEGKPTIAGIVALLQNFVSEFHNLNKELSTGDSPPAKIIRKFFRLAEKHLLPFDAYYRGETIFPVRDDGSIFMSLASFREHLLKETMVAAFGNAKSPEKIFVGAVVQNCFGRVDSDGSIHTEGKPCRTGFEVTGKNKQGRDQVTVSDAPPDKNGIESFCTDPDFKQYCDSGQVRVMYVHEPEAVGPAMARYYASKLWGGETYFVQTDSHLQFAKHWDEKYITEVKATKNYPKSVLSAYPPGFGGDGSKPAQVNESPGAKLCSCEFSSSPIEQDIIRINTGSAYHGGEPHPTQIPFIAAGFFFAHANFLRDVPFDPLMPWCFMGEEIALSVRAWTSGWNIYAPRKNLIAHQYRPGRMGLPKFWEGVNRLYRGSGADNNSLQGRVVQRVKNLIGYEDSSREILKGKNEYFLLTEQEHYGLGSVRTLDQYMDWTGINMEKKRCPQIKWCTNGDLE